MRSKKKTLGKTNLHYEETNINAKTLLQQFHDFFHPCKEILFFVHETQRHLVTTIDYHYEHEEDFLVMIGNFPYGYSHIVLIQASLENLERLLQEL